MAGLGQRQRWKKDCHLEIQDDILATELYFQAFPEFCSFGRSSEGCRKEVSKRCSVRLGTISQVLMEFVNATRHGSCSVPWGLYELAELVDELLQQSIVAEDGAHIELLPFKSKGASQTACKLVRVIGTFLTHCTGGKDRY